MVSGHRVAADNDWPQLARLDGTLVVLMAATTAALIGARLIACGARSDRPVAVVVDASGPDQRVWHTTLGGLAARPDPLPGPCAIVIGEAARRRAVRGDRETSCAGARHEPQAATTPSPAALDRPLVGALVS